MRPFLVCVALAFLVPNTHALDPRKQMSQYVHEVWNTNGGLPQDSANAIAQTPDGYLWVASQEGLARFDGVTFTNFDSGNTHGVLQNFVHTVFTDRKGTLWVGASGGMLRYDGKGRFTPCWDADQQPTTAARQISEDGAGTIWAGMGSDGITGKKGVVEFRNGVLKVRTTKDGLSSDVVSYTASDRNGNLWLATSKGIDVLEDGRVVRRYTRAQGLASDVVRVVYLDRRGTVWAGTDEGLSVLREGRFVTFTTRDGLASNQVHRLLEDRDGVLWIATLRGLNRMIDGRIERSTSLPGLTNVRIFSLFEDREGSLWIGTHVNGLHRLRVAKFTAIGPPEGLIDNSVNGIYEDGAGRIWIGTAQSGVNILEPNGIRALTAGDGLLTTAARSFREDRDGAMWIGSREGLQRLDAGSLKGSLNVSLKRAVESFTTRNGLPSESVLVTARDRRGVLWIGTDHGLARYENGRITPVPTPRGFPSTIRIIHEDRRGRLWFGGGEGLAWWDGSVFHVDPQFDQSHLQAVLEDADGTLWFGTWSQGLHRLRDGRLTKYTTASGLYDDVAWSVVDDGHGSLWMGSNRGIYRVARKDLEDYAAGRIRKIACTVFGSADGMRRRETNWGSPSAIRSRDGRLWFGTTGGVVVVDPKDIRTNPLAPPVVLERFVADDRAIESDGSPVLPPGTRNIEIHYAGLSLISPDRVRYRYRLEGYDERWIDAGARRTAYYTNVDPGLYRFRVIAANADGVWNETGASMAFRIEPYFWQTAWFYALAVATLVLLGVMLNALRERHRRIRHQAFHDSLTGLPNRTLLEDRAALALARAEKEGRSIAILFLDLDGFKRVNDTLGHASGDQLLRLVAARFRTCLRGGETLARIGGDEFAVLVEELEDRGALEEIARRIIGSIHEPFAVDRQAVTVGVSIGMACSPDDGMEVRTLLQAADRAMYRAKVDGGNAMQFHSN